MAGQGLEIKVTLRGGLFTKDIPRVVERAIIENTIDKVDERVKRGGKGLGAKRNTIRDERKALELREVSTLHNPRHKGSSWVRKNIAIVNSMAPRVIRKTADRIAAEMGGA